MKTRFMLLVLFLTVLLVIVDTDSLEIVNKNHQNKWTLLKVSLEGLLYPEECSHYTEMSSPTRSIDHKNHEEVPLCDNKLSPGWYRFTWSAGSQIATKCIIQDEDRRCSTMSAGWMVDSHPLIADGKVQRKICFYAQNKCCYASIDIQVRNCSNFYVYHLNGVPCPFRYCGSHTVSRATTSAASVQLNKVNQPATTEKLTTNKPLTANERPTTTEPKLLRLLEQTLTTMETVNEPTSPIPSPNKTDECLRYKTLVEPDRSASFYDPFVNKGDYELQSNWYRFTGKAGNKMADKCVSAFHCGTHAPGWIRGGQPSSATEHAVVKDVCFNWLGKCCFYKSHTLVCQCGDFFIYYLRRMRFKYLRYCSNGTKINS